MTFRIHPFHSFAPVLTAAVALLLSACSDESPGAAAVKPAVGSSYTYTAQAVDVQGQPSGGATDTVTYTLTGILPTFLGRTDVYQFSSKIGPIELVYLENGDISTVFVGNTNSITDSIWIDLPVSSHQTVDSVYAEKTMPVGPGVSIVAQITYHCEYTGTGTTTVNGKEIEYQSVQATIKNESSFRDGGVAVGGGTLTVLYEFHYAPELGYFTMEKITMAALGSQFGGGSQLDLTSYTLK